MYAGDHVNAAANLLWAFSNCASSSPRNKRRILLYLVPLRMLLVRLRLAVQHAQSLSLCLTTDYCRYSYSKINIQYSIHIVSDVLELHSQGVMPRVELLRAYDLDQFVDLVRAVR